MFRKIFLKDSKKWWHWVAIAIAVKLLFAALIFSQGIKTAGGNVIFSGGDTHGYLAPVDNLIEKGEYFPDYRMPGYGAVYFIFRQLFSQATAQNLLRVAQIFLSGISVYALALTVMYIFNSKTLFYGTFYMYLLSTYTSIFDIYLLADSFSVSILIFAIFYFIKGLKEPNQQSLVLSGIFLTWAVFLKPVSLPVAAIFIAILITAHMRNGIRKYFKINLAGAIFLFLLPFMLIDGIWIARNYKIYGRIIPLQKDTVYPEHKGDEVYMSLVYFLEAWGGDNVWWNPNAEICWFGYMKAAGHVRTQVKDIKFPNYIYASKFSYEDLVSVKKYIALSETPTIPQNERIGFRALAARQLREYADSIKKEKPYIYYIYAPLRILKKFLIHSGTYNLFNKVFAELNVAELGFKLLMSALYLFVVMGGFLGAIFLFFKSGILGTKSMIAVMAVYFTLIYPFGFRRCEYRYFVQAYPFMLVCTVYLVTFGYEGIKKRFTRK